MRTRTRIVTLAGASALAIVVTALFASRVVRPRVEDQRLPWSRPQVERDLDRIATDTLRVLVMRDPLSWEPRPHAETGLEFELIERFAKRMGLLLRALPMDHPDSMLMALQRGEGDIIAAQWTPRRSQRAWVSFSAPYRHVRPVIAVLRADPLMQGKGATVAPGSEADTALVSPWSPFAQKLPGAPGNKVMRVHDTLISPEELLMEVVLGRAQATLITDARAAHESGRFPVLEFSAPMDPELPLCFVVRRNAKGLLEALDEWLEDPDEREAHAQFFKVYGRPPGKPGPIAMRKRIPVENDSISPFDEAFRLHAGGMRWGWELLAAMAYRESRFDSTVTSRMGAQGIMQIMPRTGRKLGLDSSSAMSDHVAAAVRYLNKLDTMWMRAVPDREQRLRFVLGSYNAGPGHIIDAQRLAESLGLDPDRWEHHVERAILLKAKPRYFMLPNMRNGYCDGSQVFHYVRDVTGLYRQLRSLDLPDRRMAGVVDTGRGE
ncbi:MAG: transglycosylase SLT domain-containing protein [Flavobacteriales bacterium]|nr:transglycosylase SLT domain-containing protein [Flavobacteriales bacterium]